MAGGTANRDDGSPFTKSEGKKFLSRVRITKGDDCWIWMAGLNSKKKGTNYGCTYIRGRRMLTNRVALEVELGRRISNQICVLHTCDNPQCCNPSHLYEGSKLQNAQDRERRNRRVCEKGSERKNSKLDDEKVKEIRRLYRLHLKYKKFTKANLARMFRVDRVLITKVINKTAWRHVED